MPALTLEAALRTLRVLVPAMAGGVVVFAGVVIALVSGEQIVVQPRLAPSLLPILGVLIVAEIGSYLVIRQAITSAAQRVWTRADSPTPDFSPLVGRYTTLTIIGGAMAEAAGIFGSVVFLLTGQWLALVAPFLCLLALGAVFPTRARFQAFAAAVTGQTWPSDELR